MYSTFEMEQSAAKTAKVSEFPGFVLIESADLYEPLAIRTERFARLMDGNEGCIDWVFDLQDVWTEDLCYHAISKQFMRDYISDPAICSEHADKHVDIRKTIGEGRFDLIVNDQTTNDGYLYDLNGDPSYRGFALNFVARDYDLDKCIDHLKRTRSDRWTCTVGTIYEVPWYNQDSSGHNQFDLVYEPTEYEEFLKIYKLDAHSYYDAKEYMRQSLGFDKYYKDPYGHND